MTTVFDDKTEKVIWSFDIPFNPAIGEHFQLGVPYGNRELPRKFLVVQKRVIFLWDHAVTYRHPKIMLYVEEVPLSSQEVKEAKQELRELARSHGTPLSEGEW
jgi:hypothetical protein